MVKTTDDLKKYQAEATQASSAAAMKTLEGFQRLAEVNLEAARAAMEQSAEQIRALLAAKDVNTLTNLVATYAQPSADKFTAYAQAVYAIASETNADLSKMVQQQIAKGNQQMAAAIEDLAKSAPAGSEGAMAFIRQAMATANSNYDQLNDAMKRYLDLGAAQMGAAGGAASSGKKSR